MTIKVEPATPERWGDLASLYGPSGAYSSCWCMWWRVSQRDFANGNAANRRRMRAIVRDGRVPGLIAYRDGAPVGWVSVAPRSEYPRIERSPTLKPVDDVPVWSIVCFFIARGERGKGVARTLLRAAVAHARRNGARVLEGYPVDPEDRVANADAFTGTMSMFERAGFREVARRGKRPIVRRSVRA